MDGAGELVTTTMESNVVEKAKTSLSGLETVRARAKRQAQVKFTKAAETEEREQATRSSLQKLRTLKSKSCDEPYADEELAAPENVFARAWDWFQRSIGNR